jgi:hypothetical protein
MVSNINSMVDGGNSSVSKYPRASGGMLSELVPWAVIDQAVYPFACHIS